MSRVVKTIKIKSGYPHREHRSKKGRRPPIPQFGKLMIYKEKKTLKDALVEKRLAQGVLL